MATAKKTTAAEAEEITPAAETKEKTVKVRIPKTSREQGDVYVAVNQRKWLIKRGETVEVPECVAEVLQHSEDMREESLAYIEQYSNNA